MLLLRETTTRHRIALMEALDAGRIDDAAAEAAHLSSGRIADLLAGAPHGDAIALLRALPGERVGTILAAMPSSVAADILDSLELDEAAGFFRTIRPEYSADIYHIWRSQDPEWAEAVVDRMEEPFRSLIRELGTHPPGTAVDAARTLRNRGFKLLPVLDSGGRLAGVITREDAFELLAEELASGFVRSAQGSPDESFFTPPMEAVQRRLPWMGANVILNLGAVFVISSFESTIARWPSWRPSCP